MNNKVCGIVGYVDLLKECALEDEARTIVNKLLILCNEAIVITGALKEPFMGPQKDFLA